MKTRKGALEPHWLLAIAFLFSGLFFGGVATYLWIGGIAPYLHKIHPANNEYSYINPLVAVDIAGENNFFQDSTLSLEVRGMIDAAKREGVISYATLYFKDIEPGTWVGINEDDAYVPSELSKVPLMIAYFKLSENDPSTLTKQITVTQDELNAANKPLTPGTKLEVGQNYSVNDLLRSMIVDGDRAAAQALYDAIDKSVLHEVYSDIGISFDLNRGAPGAISVKLNSLFYRMLYNATYLNREDSERAIELLVIADNTKGVGALLPRSLPVANRFGEGVIAENGQALDQVSDCGIVYYPLHPYMLCAIVRGQNLGAVEKFIATLGLKLYQDIDYRYSQNHN